MKITISIIGMLYWGILFSQQDSIFYAKPYVVQKKIKVADTIVLYEHSIYPGTVTLSYQNKNINPKDYQVNYPQATLYLKDTFYTQFPKADTLFVSFRKFPDFLTKAYQVYDEKKIFPNLNPKGVLYLEKQEEKTHNLPFYGLQTDGNLARGIGIGNNQDAVVQSALDLSISGKLSSKVSLKAHINDTNVPLQDNGYSQELKDIDRIYITVTAPQWQLDAGDVMLRDSTFSFIPLNKKVQGLTLHTENKKFKMGVSGAMVKGRFSTFSFQGKESNQGPYKLQGNQGEAYIFIINNSEKVYVDGILQQNGEDKDYVMDYNTAEITFNITRPITAENRITVDYQYSERNFTRLLTHNSLHYTSDKLDIGLAFYKEGDLKKNTLSINLTEEQQNTISQSDTNSIYIENAILTPYTEQAILYKKNSFGGQTIYEHATQFEPELYDVQFTYFGKNLGDYEVQQYLANGRIMVYVGEQLGSYRAVVPITTPDSNQIVVLQTDFNPHDNSKFHLEMGVNQYHVNLFSNQKATTLPAFNAEYYQIIRDKNWKTAAHIKWEYFNQDFKSPENLLPVDFDRFWNMETTQSANQSLWSVQLNFEKPENQLLYYRFENLTLRDVYSGNRHQFGWDSHQKKWKIAQKNSWLISKAPLRNTQFLRNTTSATFEHHQFSGNASLDVEYNQLTSTNLQNYLPQSFAHYKPQFTLSVGDSTKVLLKTQYYFTQNDSVVQNTLQKVNYSHNTNWRLQWLKNKNSKLNIYFNYRNVNSLKTANIENINTSISYQFKSLQNIVMGQTDYTVNSGQVAQQEFTYVATEPGQGYYTWIDYNANQQQELDEFEIATFSDQATFLRVLLPHINYLPTQEAGWKQSVHLDFGKIKSPKWLSRVQNQLQVYAENAVLKNKVKFHYNPFYPSSSEVVQNRNNISNQLFYNRGKPNFATTYTYLKNHQKTWQNAGFIYQNTLTHLLNFQHLIQSQWQIGISIQYNENESINDLYINRNFTIISQNLNPELAYRFAKEHSLTLHSSYHQKENEIGEEHLIQYTAGLRYLNNTQPNNRFQADFTFLNNHFEGHTQTAVAFQMLEGLQKGQNFTWQFLWNQKINTFLFLNFTYQGRTNTSSRTVHTGNVQLSAQF